MTPFKQNFTFIFLILSLNIFGQTLDTNQKEETRIDSLTRVIDKRDPRKAKLSSEISIDSLCGEQIVLIEKQTFKHLSKYTLRTNKVGTRMDIKLIEIYLYNDSIIKAKVYYDLDNMNEFWKSFYFIENTSISMYTTRGMRMNPEENGEEYTEAAKKLTTQSLKK